MNILLCTSNQQYSTVLRNVLNEKSWNIVDIDCIHTDFIDTMIEEYQVDTIIITDNFIQTPHAADKDKLLLNLIGEKVKRISNFRVVLLTSRTIDDPYLKKMYFYNGVMDIFYKDQIDPEQIANQLSREPHPRNIEELVDFYREDTKNDSIVKEEVKVLEEQPKKSFFNKFVNRKITSNVKDSRELLKASESTESNLIIEEVVSQEQKYQKDILEKELNELKETNVRLTLQMSQMKNNESSKDLDSEFQKKRDRLEAELLEYKETQRAKFVNELEKERSQKILHLTNQNEIEEKKLAEVINSKNDELEQLKQKLAESQAELESKRTNMQQEISDLNKQVSQITTELDHLSKEKEQTLQNLQYEKETIQELNRQRVQIEEEHETMLDEHKKSLSNLNENFEEENRKMNFELNSVLNTISQQKNNLNTLLEKQNHITNELNQNNDSDNIEKLQKELQHSKEKVQQVQNKMKNAESKKEKINSHLALRKKEFEAEKTLMKEEYSKEIEKYKAQQLADEQKIHELSQSVHILQESLNNSTFNMEELEQLREEIKNIKNNRNVDEQELQKQILVQSEEHQKQLSKIQNENSAKIISLESIHQEAIAKLESEFKVLEQRNGEKFLDELNTLTYEKSIELEKEFKDKYENEIFSLQEENQKLTSELNNPIKSSMGKKNVLVFSYSSKSGSTFVSRLLADYLYEQGKTSTYIENPFVNSYLYPLLKNNIEKNHKSLFQQILDSNTNENENIRIDVSNIIIKDNIEYIVNTPQDKNTKYNYENLTINDFYKVLITTQSSDITLFDGGSMWDIPIFQELIGVVQEVIFILDADASTFLQLMSSNDERRKSFLNLINKNNIKVILNRFDKNLLSDEFIPDFITKKCIGNIPSCPVSKVYRCHLEEKSVYKELKYSMKLHQNLKHISKNIGVDGTNFKRNFLSLFNRQ